MSTTVKEKLRRKLEKVQWTLEDLASTLDRVPKLIDPVIYGGLAYLGWNTFKTLPGALFGPISLKLALSPGGTPPIAQISGIAGLVILGVARPTRPIQEYIGEAVNELKNELKEEKGATWGECIAFYESKGLPFVGAMAKCESLGPPYVIPEEDKKVAPKKWGE